MAMRWREVMAEQKPLNPEQARKRAEKLTKAQGKLRDAQTISAVKIDRARQALAEL